MCAPEPTPPRETAAAQDSTSWTTSLLNSITGNPNEITPEGTKTSEITGSYSFTNPYTGITMDAPQRTITQTRSPQLQAIEDQRNAAKLNLAQYGNEQTAGLKDFGSAPFSYDAGAHEKWAGGLYDKLNSESNAAADEALRSRLSNQGIKLGSTAYDRETRNRDKAEMDARNEFMLNSQNQGFSQAQAARNQRFNEPLAIASGTQLQQPNFMAGFQASPMPTTDTAGIINNYDAARAAAARQNGAGVGSVLGGLGGLFSLSDKRAKKDIERVGKTGDGLGIFKYRYKDESENAPIRVGLMAQEVAKKKPDAVAMRPDGLLAVNYDRALSPIHMGV